MAGLDTFFKAAPYAARGSRQAFQDITATLQDVASIDQYYRNIDERKARQDALARDMTGGAAKTERIAGLAPPSDPYVIANDPLKGGNLPEWNVPAPAPAPAPAAEAPKAEAPAGKVDATTVVSPDQKPTTATQVLQQWEAKNGQLPPAVRDQVYKNAQGKSASLTVPDYIPGGKSRVGEVDAGIPGYEVIDPNASAWRRDTTMSRNENAINVYLQGIRSGLASGDYGLAGNVFGSIKGYFTDTKQEAEKRTAIQNTFDWFNTKEAAEYFRQNPNALPLAKLDPVGFVDSFKREAGIRQSRRDVQAGLPEIERAADIIQFIESRNDPTAISPKGAQGLMQIMPGTGKSPGFGVAPLKDNSPAENRRMGRDYYAAMLQRYNGNEEHALAAYNWGPGNVDAWLKKGGNFATLPKETRNYIAQYRQLAQDGIPAANAQAQAVPSTVKRIVIGDSVAEGFAKANNIPGSYKTGESPQAVLKRLQDYVAKNDIKGAVVYVGTGLPNNPQQQAFVDQQIALIKEKGGIPFILGVGPGTQQNPTTGQNEYLARVAEQNQINFTGPLATMFPSVSKEKMGLHLTPAQYKTLYGMTSQRVQIDNTGRTVPNPQQNQQQQPPAPAVVDNRQPAPVAGLTDTRQPAVAAPATVQDEALKQSRRAVTMTPDQHNVEVGRIVKERQDAITMYERAKEYAYVGYEDSYNRLNSRRQLLAGQAEAARKVGNIETAMNLLTQIDLIDGEILKAKQTYLGTVNQHDLAIKEGLAGIDNNLSLALAYQGVNDLANANNPTRLERMWSRFSGQEIRIQPRSDGNVNLWMSVGGQLTPVGVYSKEDIANKALGDILPSHRAKQMEATYAMKQKLFDLQADVWKKAQGELAEMVKGMRIEEIKQNSAIIQERLKLSKFGALKEAMGPNGPMLYALSDDGSAMIQIDPNPPAMDKDGKYPNEPVKVMPTGIPRAGLTMK